MECSSNNVIQIGQGAADLGRTFWSFRYPHELVQDPRISANDKRAVLSTWASDEYAVESLPTLRHLPGTPFPVTFSSIMDARLHLDRVEGWQGDDPPPSPHRMRPNRVPVSEAA